MDDMAEVPGDWGTYRVHILSELRRIGEDVVAIDRKLDRFREEDLAQIKLEVAMLKVKSGLWGGLSGLVTAVGAALLLILARKGP